MIFGYTILYVNDVEKALNFYVSAFGFERKMLHESGDYGELDTGNTTLSFSSIKLMGNLGKKVALPDICAPSFEIAFVTENINEALKTAIDAGASLIQDVEEMPWGQSTAYVNDINGFLIEICTPIKNQE